jgi:hypothetical protein
VDRRQFLARAASVSLGGAVFSVLAAFRLARGQELRSGTPGGEGSASATEPPGGPGPSPAASSTPGATSAAEATRRNPIAIENALDGEGGWEVVTARGEAVGYFDEVSVEAGETLALHVSSPTTYDVFWYRLGWYGGQGARSVRVDRGLPPYAGVRPAPDGFGRVQCDWPAALSIRIPPDWTSGYYLAVIRPPDGKPTYVPFVVRPPKGGRAPVLIVSAAATWQAYNTWGGKNVYDANSVGALTVTGTKRAAVVSFDRPYQLNRGAGHLLHYEYPFARWVEREGRDVEYATDIDLGRHPEVLEGRKMVVLIGHPEYWSRPMRDGIVSAIEAGTNVLFLCANEIYWQVRLIPSPLGEERNLVCYKVFELDPVAAADPARATVHWRDAELGLPEARIVGQQYGHVVNRFGDWTVKNSDHWLYEGTGLKDGDRIPRLIGPEYDTFFEELAPEGTLLLAEGAVDAKLGVPVEGGETPSPAIHTSTIYVAPSGATVFAAGTFLWGLALDGYRGPDYREEYTPVDARIAKMTHNLFDRLGDGPA